MNQKHTHIVEKKTPVKLLPGNIKLVFGKSVVEKLEQAKAVSASIKGFKK